MLRGIPIVNEFACVRYVNIFAKSKYVVVAAAAAAAVS